MPQHLRCPGCGVALVIRDFAPANLTCPRCLSAIRNPHAGAARDVPESVRTRARNYPFLSADAAVHSNQAGSRAVNYSPPADHEATGDIRKTAYSIVVLACTLAAGTLISLAAGSTVAECILPVGLILAAGVTIHYWKQQRRGLEPSVASEVNAKLARGCAGAVIIFFCIIALLLGLCAGAAMMTSAGVRGH
jgi:hypothetical protein